MWLELYSDLRYYELSIGSAYYPCFYKVIVKDLTNLLCFISRQNFNLDLGFATFPINEQILVSSYH
jgi:hypothetical protein